MDKDDNVNQPQPKFNLLDLEAKIEAIYAALMAKNQSGQLDPDTKQARQVAQELLHIVAKIKNDLDVIEMPIDVSKAITDTIATEKPELIAVGVQLYEYGKLQGVSLYTTVAKARNIKDICNKRFAELRVDHVCKLMNYPIY